MARQRPDQRLSSRGVVQPADGQQSLAQPRPEGSIHCAQTVGQPGRARQHQQERRVGPHLLAGVEQNTADIGSERVRFVEQHGQRLLAATSGQRAGEVAPDREVGWPFRRARGCDADLARQPPGDADSRRQGVRKGFAAGDAVRRQGLDGHRPRGAGGPEPLEQCGLAVSSRAQQDDVVGRGDAGDEVAEAAREHRLLDAAPREGRRQGAVAGPEQASRRGVHRLPV